VLYLLCAGLVLGPPPAHRVFGYQGQWFQPEGKAIIPIMPGELMHRGREYVISFSVHNVDGLAREAADVYVAASGNNLVYDQLLAGDEGAVAYPGSVDGDASPLKLYTNAFSVAHVGQDSPFPLAENTIHVTIAAWQGLSAGTIIDVEGLTGSTTSTGTLDITQHTQGPRVFASTASWVSGNGALSLQTVADVNASTIYRFSFSLNNMQWQQSSPIVSIEARGGAYPIPKHWPVQAGSVLNPALASIPLLPLPEAAAPLHIMAMEFYVKRCSQDTSFPSR